MKPWLLALVLVLAAPAARAQPAAPAVPAAPAAPAAQPAATAAIPVGEIVGEAQAVDRWRRDVEAELAAGIEQRTEALLGRTEGEISRRRTALDQLPAGPSAARALGAVRAGWEEIQGELAAAQDELERGADGLDRRLREAQERTERWRLTASEARRADVPPPVLKAVQEALATVAGVRGRVEKSRNELLALEQRVSDQRHTADAALERVERMRGELRSQLLVRNLPPLWSLRPVRDAPDDLRQLVDTLAATAQEIGAYAVRGRDRLLVQLALIGLLIWAAVRGRPILRRVCGEDESAADVLAHPAAAGLLAGLAPVRAFNPDAPYGFVSSLAVLALAPWLRVLSGVLPRPLYAPLRWLAALVLLEFARGGLHAAPLLARAALLLELGVGIALAARLRRPEPMAQIAQLGGRAWQRALDLWLRLALVLLAAGIPAAVLGYGELANVLAGTVVLGSFMGTVLLIVVLVLELLLRAVIEAGVLDGVHLIRTQHGPLRRGASWLLRAAAAGAWLYLALDYTTLGDPLWPWIGRVLAAPIGYGSVSVTLGGLLAFSLALWASWLLARFSSFALDTEVFPRLNMPPGIPFALATFTRYAVLFAGFVIALGLVGFSLDRVTIVLGGLGVGVGFGLQNVVNNFVSGVILLFERPIRVGDRIQLDQLVGDVTRIGMRASRVRTLDGLDLIVPNADFVSARVTNWTLSDRARRVSLPVGVAYGTRPQRVLELLGQVARTHPEVLASPGPEVFFRGFGDSSLDFELRVWTDSRLVFRVESDLAVATYDALEQAGITIPFPQRDLHLQSVSPAARSALTRGAPGDDER